MSDVLLLNLDGQPLTLWPLSTISWQQAIKAHFLGKVKILKTYDDWICRSQHLAMPMPSVVMMSRYRPHAGKVNFTRRNIYLRDGFKCQYCLKILSTEQLTIDHVIPKSKGGGTRWDNVVAACHRCNLRKGASIEKPVKKPYEPNYWKMVELAKSLPRRIPDPQWQDYLQWPEDLIKVVRAKAA